jgi:hypothetical protein
VTEFEIGWAEVDRMFQKQKPRYAGGVIQHSGLFPVLSSYLLLSRSCQEVCKKIQAACLVGSVLVCTAIPSLNRFPS